MNKILLWSLHSTVNNVLWDRGRKMPKQVMWLSVLVPKIQVPKCFFDPCYLCCYLCDCNYATHFVESLQNANRPAITLQEMQRERMGKGVLRQSRWLRQSIVCCTRMKTWVLMSSTNIKKLRHGACLWSQSEDAETGGSLRLASNWRSQIGKL